MATRVRLNAGNITADVVVPGTQKDVQKEIQTILKQKGVWVVKGTGAGSQNTLVPYEILARSIIEVAQA